MVRRLRWQGIDDEGVLRLIESVPREKFTLPEYAHKAYEDMRLPIGFGQSLNAPLDAALVLMALQPQKHERILEVGTGSGYQSALFSRAAKEVYTIEIIDELAKQASKRLLELGYDNVFVRTGDGFFGWPDKAPFDKIFLDCSPQDIPSNLIMQLKEGGRILMPLGAATKFQEWLLSEKRQGKLVEIRKFHFRRGQSPVCNISRSH